MESTEPLLTADEALRRFNIIKSDRRNSPHAVQMAWEDYVEACERERAEKAAARD